MQERPGHRREDVENGKAHGKEKNSHSKDEVLPDGPEGFLRGADEMREFEELVR